MSSKKKAEETTSQQPVNEQTQEQAAPNQPEQEAAKEAPKDDCAAKLNEAARKLVPAAREKGVSRQTAEEAPIFPPAVYSVPT